MNASGGGRVCFLEQKTHQIPNRLIYALKAGAPSSSARVLDGPNLRAFCRARARVFDNLHPAAHDQQPMSQRMLAELNDADGLRQRRHPAEAASGRTSGHRLPAGGARPLYSFASSAHWQNPQAPATMPGAGLL